MSTTLFDTGELVNTTEPTGIRLMDLAIEAPPGWLQGLSVPFYGCGTPTLQNRCTTAYDTPHRTILDDFPAFGIAQGATCSSLSKLDHEDHVRHRLNETSEWALGRQLAADSLGLGAPSLDDAVAASATIAGGDITLAVGTLEQAAADAGFGSEWWLHSSVFGAAYLTANRQMNQDGLSPNRAPIVVSPGYLTGDAPTTLRLWATGPVWVGLTDMYAYRSVDRREGNDTAYGQRDAIAAFNPCINLYIDITL